MLRTLIFLLLTLTLIQTSCIDDQKNTDERPNIILIMADDMGYSDLGCFGSEINTPNLDKLAAEGLRITQFYNAGRCCPTRASLLTGLYQHQAGVGDMVSDFGIPAYQGYLNKECVTLGEVMKLNGYNTYMAGKWHVGGEPEQWPVKRGFDRYFGLIDGASNYFNLNPYRINQAPLRMALDDQPYFPPDSGFYMTDAFTDYALTFLEEQKKEEEPFFLYLPYTAPHWPLHAWPEDIEKYRGSYLMGWDSLRITRYNKMIRSGLILPEWELSNRHDNIPEWTSLSEEEKDMWDLRMVVYAAMVDRLDQNIGRVLEKLTQIGADENTLVVFIADNGGCHERIKNRGNYVHTTGITGNADSFDAYEYEWANVSNTPFRWFKHWVHEGGISSPFIAWAPGMIEGGRTVYKAAHIIDIMPTFVELADGHYPDEYDGNKIKPMMGQSLVPVLLNEQTEWDRILFWEHEGNRAIRKGDWKMVSRYDYEPKVETPWELYDLAADRSEMHDLSQEKPELLEEMIQLYNEMARKAEVTPWPEVIEIRANR
ncbi:MAG: arylsulfatase [Bacteroidales bacterium]|nr:arylsulfatase [Bacteroidales bacterium]